jgi:enamine deaminase RidA (YjgF/YER057c/UK114 family)
MRHTRHDIGIASRIGPYSDGVEVGANKRWLITAGTPGMTLDGIMPADITAQAELAWQHIIRMLKSAGMDIGDLVKITQYLVRAEDIPAYAKVRARVLGDARPASMLMVVAALPRPDFLIEIEAHAAKA